jgi:tRNA pseudouridine38-40 synthase
VAHLDLTPSQLKRIGRNPDVAGRVNTALPKDIRVFGFEVAPEGFDARYSATFRKYRYRVADKNCFVDPLDVRYVLEVKPELDLKLMKQTAKVLIGLHDFGGFCKPRPGATTIRRLRSIKISRNQSKGRIIEIELKGDAFCHNMVRSIVGALVAVGRGRASVSDVQKRLKSGSRAGSLKVVAAKGLSLIEVGYPKDSRMGIQAQNTRKRRVLEEN